MNTYLRNGRKDHGFQDLLVPQDLWLSLKIKPDYGQTEDTLRRLLLSWKRSGIDLFKDGIEGTPNYIDWIISEIPAGGKVAVNALATSHSNWEALDTKFSAKNISLTDLPLLKEIWTDRGTAAKNPIYVHPVERAGQSVQDKIAAIRQKMEDQPCQCTYYFQPR